MSAKPPAADPKNRTQNRSKAGPSNAAGAEPPAAPALTEEQMQASRSVRRLVAGARRTLVDRGASPQLVQKLLEKNPGTKPAGSASDAAPKKKSSRALDR